MKNIKDKIEGFFHEYIKNFEPRNKDIEDYEDDNTQSIKVTYNKEAYIDLEIKNLYQTLQKKIPHLTDNDNYYLSSITENPITNKEELKERLDTIEEVLKSKDKEKLKEVKRAGSKLKYDSTYSDGSRDSKLQELYNIELIVNFIDSVQSNIEDPQSKNLKEIKDVSDKIISDEGYKKVDSFIKEIVNTSDLIKNVNSLRNHILKKDSDIFNDVGIKRTYFKNVEVILEAIERLSEDTNPSIFNAEIDVVEFYDNFKLKTKELGDRVFSFTKFDKYNDRKPDEQMEDIRLMTDYLLDIIDEGIKAKLPKLDIGEFPEKLGYFIAASDLISEFQQKGINFVRPEILDKKERKVDITNSYNLSLLLNGKNEIIPNDIHSDPDKNLFAITGPNNGGKTTFIRHVGQMYWLAHIGMYVPAESAQISIIDKAFTSFSGEDNTNAGLGQYLTELRRINKFTNSNGKNISVTPYSVVFFDEFANGTDHEEAVNRTKMVLKHLSEKGTTSYFTTHKHEISEHIEKGKILGGMNLAIGIEKNGRNITPTHKIVRDQKENSYGYVIAEEAGITEENFERTINKELKEGKYPIKHTRVEAYKGLKK